MLSTRTSVPLDAGPSQWECSLCKAQHAGRRFPTANVDYVLCGRCGGATADSVIDPDTFYADYFPAAVQGDSPLLARRYGEILRQLEHRAPGRRLLEVGCGNGQFLAVARVRGWEVAGTELSEAQVEHCTRRGFDVVRGDLTEADLFENREFDAVVLIEVFEHLPRPLNLMGTLARTMAPRGQIYLTTPNFNSVSRRLLGGRWSVLNREHVTLATPTGLRTALEHSGFRVKQIRSRNVNVAEIRRGVRPDSGQSMTARERVAAAATARDRIERSRLLRGAKRLANFTLAATGSGDTLVAWAEKRRSLGAAGE